MKQTFFKSDIKMVDMLNDNYHFLQLLDRFDIKFGFGDQTVEEVCKKHNININFFILICNVFHYKEYVPSEENIRECPPDELLKYLQKSHENYRHYRLPKLDKQLKEMMVTWENKPANVVNSFFAEYRKEVEEHLSYEDNTVFPYIGKLIKNEQTKTYSILEFEEKHDDIEAKVIDLKNILIKYIPERNDAMQRNEILLQLYLLEEDLQKHLLIENKVLIPVVLLMEKKKSELINHHK